MTKFVYSIEILGTIAFAISGAMVASRKKMDIFGVMVLGVTTAVGGGMIRDLILGINPPIMFINSSYVFVAVLTSILIFIIFFHLKKHIEKYNKQIDSILNIFDAIGLGAFVVAGVNTAISHGFEDFGFLVIFVGTLSGIGGGILRDIFAGRIPVVLRKRVYAIAAIVGAMTYYYTYAFIPYYVAMAFGIVVTIVDRKSFV